MKSMKFVGTLVMVAAAALQAIRHAASISRKFHRWSTPISLGKAKKARPSTVM